MSKPKYQLFDDLPEKDYLALKEDIAQRGIIVPVEVDEHGNILDGHHRDRAWSELKAEGRVNGADYARIVRAGMTEAEKRNHIRAINCLRRHLTTKQKQEYIDASLKDEPEKSDRQHAEALGVTQPTVSSRRKKLEKSGELIKSISSIGKDKKWRTRKPRPNVYVKSKKEQQRAIEAFEKTANLPDKALDLKRLERIAREQAAADRGAKVKGDVSMGKTTLLLGDMKERGAEIESDSIDLIFTDPPYHKEHLPLWSDLSALAARVLKPNGMLIAYTGAMYLPEVMARLSECLSFWWVGSIVLDGPHSRVHNKNVMQGSKPLLFYTRKEFEPSEWFEDTYKSEGEQKEGHDWQQSLGAALYYIEKITGAEGTVLDPFLGAGTTGEAAINLGRSFIGIEIDKAAFANASERINANG